MSYDPLRASDPPKPAHGITCPKCGNRRLRAIYTRHRTAAVVRVRKCNDPDCGHRIRTVERVESVSS